jgi:hypothetical protein
MRALHWVGTTPPSAGTTDEAKIRWIIKHSRGQKLRSIPCDQDEQWIIRYLDALEEIDVFEVARPGDFSEYATMRTYRRKTDPASGRRVTLLPEHVSEHRVEQIRDTLETFRAIRREDPDLEQIPLQVSVAASLDLALFTFVGDPFKRNRVPLWIQAFKHIPELFEALAHVPVFDEARRQEIAELCSIPGDGADLAFQLESPAILRTLDIVPALLRRAVAKDLARQTARFLASLPAAARVRFLHPCNGNLGDEPLFMSKNLKALRLYLNALGAELDRLRLDWPEVHVPVAVSKKDGVPTSRRFFRALRALHKRWSLIAGVADEHHPNESETALHLFERESGRMAHAVATGCGQGRSSEDDAEGAASVLIKLALAEYQGARS